MIKTEQKHKSSDEPRRKEGDRFPGLRIQVLGTPFPCTYWSPILYHYTSRVGHCGFEHAGSMQTNTLPSLDPAFASLPFAFFVIAILPGAPGPCRRQPHNYCKSSYDRFAVLCFS
eukprot:746001-Hanusia_phi.AAC.1